MIAFWGGLGLGYTFSPDANILRTGTFEFVNDLSRWVWSPALLLLAAAMAYGGATVNTKPNFLRTTLGVGFFICFVRGILMGLPFVIDVINGSEGGLPASFGGIPTYLCMGLVHWAALTEPFRNPITERHE